MLRPCVSNPVVSLRLPDETRQSNRSTSTAVIPWFIVPRYLSTSTVVPGTTGTTSTVVQYGTYSDAMPLSAGAH